MRTVPAERLPIIDGDTARLPLTKGQVAIIDAADVDAVSGTCWYALWSPKLGTYYAARNASKPLVVGTPSIVYLHRLLIDAPAGRYVDHANHDTLDNRRCNLRVATSVRTSATETSQQATPLATTASIDSRVAAANRGQRMRPSITAPSTSATSRLRLTQHSRATRGSARTARPSSGPSMSRCCLASGESPSPKEQPHDHNEASRRATRFPG